MLAGWVLARASAAVAVVVLATVVVLAIVVPASASALTFNVAAGASDAPDANPGDGICDDGTGACPLRAAVMEANALPGSHTIAIPAGTVELSTPVVTDDESDGGLEITGPVEINGAGIGQTTIEQTVAPPAASDRVLSIDVPSFSDPVALRDLTVTGGFVDGAPSSDGGGGIRISGSGQTTIALERVRVTGNVVEGEENPIGGGVFMSAVSGPALHVTDSVIDANQVTNSDPSASVTQSAVGGGIAASGGVSSELLISGSRIADNEVTALSPDVVSHAGGGIRVNVASFELADTLIRGNSAGRAGGLFINLPAAGAGVERTTFAENEALEGSAGAIMAFGSGTLAVTDSTLNDHASVMNGRVILMNSGSTLALDSVTISDDDAASTSMLTGIAATLSLRRTILDHQGVSLCSGSSFSSSGDNLFSIDDADCDPDPGQGDLVAVDPMLAPLADNGGPTPTLAPDQLSPAIDAVANEPCPPPGTDQRGVTRPQGDACDIGAFEVRPAAVIASAQPQRRTVPPRKKRARFLLRARNVGDAPTGVVRLCAWAPRKGVGVRGKACVTRQVPPSGIRQRAVKLRIRPKARGKLARVRLAVRGPGIENRRAVARLRVRSLG